MLNAMAAAFVEYAKWLYHSPKKSKNDYDSRFEHVQARKNPFKTPDKNVKRKALKRDHPKEIISKQLGSKQPKKKSKIQDPEKRGLTLKKL